MTMTSASIRTTLAAVGNCGKTTIARHVLASGGSPIATLETHSASGEEADAIDRDGLAARLFAPPAGGVVIDVGVGDAVAALEALTLVGRQDPSLPKRLRLVVPLLVDGKSVAGLRWLLSQLPAALRPAVRAVFPAHAGMNRIENAKSLLPLSVPRPRGDELSTTPRGARRLGVPRPRGDEPPLPTPTPAAVRCSPPTRG
jgi:hypothetical protein